MNTYKDRPMPFGAKVKKLFGKQFYLNRVHFDELVYLCEYHNYTVRDAIAFIDEHGSWLDG